MKESGSSAAREFSIWGDSTSWLYGQAALIAVSPWFILIFLMPDRLTHRVGAPPVGYILFGAVIGIVLVALAVIFLMHPHPSRSVQAASAVSALLMYLGSFTYVFYVIALVNVHAFNQHLGRLDALYFALTVFTTTGFGDIAPISQGARLATSVEMILTVTVFGALLAATVRLVADRGRDPSPGDATSTATP